jgi:ubiquinone/menaquinone biosynthesis C-methylase UbiE
MTDFDERAKEWDSDPAKVERARVVANAMRAALPLNAKMTALEYGCGTGLLSFALQPEFAAITLADSSEGMLAMLAGKLKAAGVNNLFPLKLDLACDPLPASRFEVTFSLMTLHHIPQVDFVLGQFFALLAPGGWLCIADLEAEDGSFHPQGTPGIHFGFERAALQKQVEAAGFGEVHFSTAFEIHKMVGGENKSFPVFLLTAHKP